MFQEFHHARAAQVTTYRAMIRADLPAAHRLSAQLNWPHRLEDWALLHRLCKGFAACEGERLIGTAFACPQGAFATIGLVVVSPDYQGQGVGRRFDGAGARGLQAGHGDPQCLGGRRTAVSEPGLYRIRHPRAAPGPGTMYGQAKAVVLAR